MAKKRTRKSRIKGKIGEYLVSEGRLSKEDVDSALAHQRRWGKKLGEALVALGKISEDEMYKLLADFLDMPYFPLEKLRSEKLNPKILALINEEEAVQHRVVPLQHSEKNGRLRFVLATSQPMNFDFLDQLRFRSGAELLVMVATDDSVDRFIARHYKGTDGAGTVDFVDYFTDWLELGDGSVASEAPEDEATEPYSDSKPPRRG